MPPRTRKPAEEVVPDSGSESTVTESPRSSSQEPDRQPPTIAQRLREPFKPEQIGKLPRLTCPDCIKKNCNVHRKISCTACGNWISEKHIHIDYVGHAAITDRLGQVDPDWNWEPAYRNVEPHAFAAAIATGNPDIVAMIMANSPPLTDGQGMWVKLTVGGVTRLGYANDDKGGIDHNKILIGDGLRNAGMRFGIAIQQWSKEDLTPSEVGAPPNDATFEKPPAAADPAEGSGRQWMQEATDVTTVDGLLAIGKECNEVGEFVGVVREFMMRRRTELLAAAEPPKEEEVPPEDEPPF